MKSTYAKGKQDKNDLIVNQINIVSATRALNDIGTFKTALNSAESVSYPSRALLYDLYNHSLLDGHLSGIVEKRIHSVLNKELHFIDNNGTRVKEFDRVICSEAFQNVKRAILESIYWGISGLEFIPGPALKVKEIPRKHIKPESKTIAIDQSDSVGSIEYESLSHVWIVGKTDNLGLLLNATPLAIYKRGVFGDWAQFIEIFGQPIRVISYGAHDVKSKMEIRQVLDESGSSLALMIPKQVEFKLFDGKESNADGELQNKFIKSCNQEMSVLILGNTETTTSSKNSGLAQAEVHAQQQEDIIKSDIHLVQSELNSKKFKSILKSYGLPVENGSFRFHNEIDLHTLRQRLDIDLFVNKFVPIDDDYWYRTYGIAKPKNYDELMRKRKIEAKQLVQSEPVIQEEVSLWAKIWEILNSPSEKNVKKMKTAKSFVTNAPYSYDAKKASEGNSWMAKLMGKTKDEPINLMPPIQKILNIFK